MPPKMPPAMPPKQPFAEKIQWIILIGGFASLYIIILFQNQQMQNLADRITRATESNDYAVGVIERRLLEFGVPELVKRGTETSVMEEKPPQNIDIPGTRARLTVPGTWDVSRDGDAINLQKEGTLAVEASVFPIREEDLQIWFRENRAELESPWDDRKPTVGPNQVLMGGHLAIDEQYDDSRGPSVVRLTFVREGGYVIRFAAVSDWSESSDKAQAKMDLSETMAEWDAALKTLTFATQ